MAKRNPNLTHAEIKARTLEGHGRTGLVAAGNPDVLAEANAAPGAAQGDSGRLKSGPAWSEGLRHWRAGGATEHHPGKMDGPDIGRGKAITY